MNPYTKFTSHEQWAALSAADKQFINEINASFINAADAQRRAVSDYDAVCFVHAYAVHPSNAVLKIKLTDRSMEIFKDACEDAGNWSGSPCLGGNFPFTKEDRGNLTQLKRAKLLTTDKSDGEEWIRFTQLGHEFAAFHGIEMTA